MRKIVLGAAALAFISLGPAMAQEQSKPAGEPAEASAANDAAATDAAAKSGDASSTTKAEEAKADEAAAKAQDGAKAADEKKTHDHQGHAKPAS
jgi:hypothetical protein